MKDEIKEILDELNKDKEEIRHYEYYPDDVLTCEDLIKILDYITNLQEENEKLKEDIRKDEVYFKTFELAEECDQKQDIIDDYKSRNEKAYNKLETMFDNGNEESILDDLLELREILQGSDK